MPNPVIMPSAASDRTQWMLRLAMLLICTSTYGKCRALDAVLQGIAGIGEASRIHDQPVEALIDSLIDAIDRLAFDVGVEDLQPVAVVARMALQHGVQVGGSCRAVDLRFAPPEKRKIGALQK